MPTNSIAIIDHVGCKAGMDSYSGALAKGFKENKVDCYLFSNFEIDGVRSFSFFRKRKGSKLSSILNQVIPFWKAGKVCKKNRVEECIVHFFSFEIKDLIALKILRHFGLKIIGIVHDVEHLGGSQGVYREKILSSYSDKLMVHNHFSKEELLRAYPQFASKVKIIPHMNFHSLPLGKDKVLLREKWNMKAERKYLLFFGQIKEAKGLDVLLAAMKGINEDVGLIVAGKVWQTDFNAYQKIIDNNKLHERVTKYIRFITDEERDELFTACDMIVLPYKKIYQSGVMQVAMSYKIPIIASDILPFKEIIGDNENGYLFESEHVQSLGEAINLVVNNPLKAIDKSERAYKMAEENFSNRKVAKTIINW